MQIVPTLNFGGNCREAIQLYEKAFNGKIACMITYGEANDPSFVFDGSQKDYFLTMIYDTKEEVQKAYEIMKEGSTTIYQLEATSYSSCRVVFVDRFGIRWGIMTEQTER